jgi:hypothetical protein
MKWVILAIIACVIPYTWITLAYRKPNPAFQPYEDSKQRANVMRLLEAGYQRLSVSVTRPADPQDLVRGMAALADVTPATGGLTPSLTETLVEVPQLPVSFSSVSAPRETASLLPYPIVFTCVLGDQKHQLGGAQVFVREQDVVIVPGFEPLDEELTARTKESPVLLTLPSGALKSGRYTVLLAGKDESRQWTVEVR